MSHYLFVSISKLIISVYICIYTINRYLYSKNIDSINALNSTDLTLPSNTGIDTKSTHQIEKLHCSVELDP